MHPVIDRYRLPPAVAARAPRRFHVMAKPVGSACNLDCSYCYYLSKDRLAGMPAAARMSDAVLEAFVRDYIASVTGDEVVFSWQGGEPTLLGVEWFEKVVALQRRYAKAGQRIENDLQTNGTLLDDDWARFLKANRFLVGLSIDGPQDVHDAMRPTKKQQPSFDEVMRGAGLLRRHGVPFNTLTCVHRGNATRPLDIYRFLRREVGSTYMQFIPIVEPRNFETTAPGHGDTAQAPVVGTPRAKPDHPLSVVTPWSVDPDDYGRFLCAVWDEWLARDLGKVLVNFCETLVVQKMGQPSQLCIYARHCGKGGAIENDGSVYSCDHYVYPEFRLGHVGRRSLAEMMFDPVQVRFGYAKSEELPATCRRCSHLADCWGECPKNRLLRTPDGEPGLNYLCSGLKRFFDHAGPQARQLAAQIQRSPLTAPTSPHAGAPA